MPAASSASFILRVWRLCRLAFELIALEGAVAIVCRRVRAGGARPPLWIGSPHSDLVGDGRIYNVIVVVEGVSAVGKTTWCATHGSGNVVAETGPIEPPAGLGDHEHAQFWHGVNCGRWAEAMTVEAECGLAICDTRQSHLGVSVGGASCDRARPLRRRPVPTLDGQPAATPATRNYRGWAAVAASVGL